MTAGPNPLPLFSCQIAFTSNPLDTNQVWQDVADASGTQLIQTARIVRGRQHVLNTIEPGRMTAVFANLNRELDPTNTASPYYPNVDINKRIRLGVVVNALTAAQAAITGGWSAGSNTTLSYASSKVTLTATASGTVSASTPLVRISPSRDWLGLCTVQNATTARSVTVTLTWADKSGTTISSQSQTLTDSGATAFSINPSGVMPANAVKASLTVSVAGCAAGEQHTVTLAGILDGAIATTWQPGDPAPLFTGFINSIRPTWPSQMRSNTVAIEASDTQRILQQTKLPPDPYTNRVLGLGATQLWPCDDPSGTTHPRQLVGGGLGAFVFPGGGGTITFGGSPRFGALLSSTGAITSAAGAFAALGIGASSAPISGTGAFALECWIQPQTGSAGASGTIYQQYAQSTGAQILLSWDTALHLVVSNGTTTVALASNPVTLNDGNWHLVTAGRDGAGNYWIYLDGVQVGTIGLTSPDPANGGVSWAMWFYDARNGPAAFTNAAFSCATIYGAGITGGTASILGNYQVGSQYFLTPRLSTSRMVDVMTLLGFPSNLYAAAGSGSDVGRSNVQGSQSHPGFAHGYLQTVAQAENGMILTRPDGVVVAFDRYHQQNVAPTAIFGDAGNGTEIPYQPNPEFAKDNVDLFNASTCQAVNGNPQTAVGSTVTQYGVTSSLDETNLLSAGGDNEMLGRAQWNASRFATPLLRVRAIEVDCVSYLGLIGPKLLTGLPTQAVELGQQVTVNRRPFSLSAGFAGALFSQASIIEGLEHHITLGGKGSGWRASLHLSPADTQVYWVIGSGALDTTTRLAY